MKKVEATYVETQEQNKHHDHPEDTECLNFIKIKPKK